ncbi:MAG TPA: phosphate acyltransferase PlsX [Vicinamibacterales bacterium]|jgi:glycerol-3-phosphate acyltransferase PlsX
MIRIAVDAMGGDLGPETIVSGALAAARDDRSLALTLIGQEDRLRAAMGASADAAALDVRIVPASDVIGMGEPPTAALRRRPNASIRVAAAEVASGRAAALFSAGNTGATVMAAHAAFGMLKGADRPALATTIPTRLGVAVLLDVGANVDCRPQHLVQFAAMGRVYARLALGIEAPRIGLLSIGEEENKGNDLTREAHRLLKAGDLTFIGNIEARDIYAGRADVVVCDGFTGNIALKVSEGLVELIGDVLREGLAGFGLDASSPPGREAFDLFHTRVDYSEYGGAPLLGVAGLAVVGHGRSSAKAVRQGIKAAQRFAAGGFIARLQQDIIACSAGHQ